VVLFARAQAVVIFPAPRRVGDSDKSKEQRNLREFHTVVQGTLQFKGDCGC